MRFLRSSLAHLAVLVGLFASGVPVQAQLSSDGIRALESAAAYYAQLDAYCMEFHQNLEVPLLGESHDSYGRICQRSPDRLRMQFSVPETDLIIGDGEFLWVYAPSILEGQVTRFALDSGDGAFDIRREFLDSPMEKYEVTDRGSEMLNGRRVAVLDLLPNDRLRYQKATVWIAPDSNLLLQVEILETQGSIRRLTFTDFDASPQLAADDFTFLVPDGVRVVVR